MPTICKSFLRQELRRPLPWVHTQISENALVGLAFFLGGCFGGAAGVTDLRTTPEAVGAAVCFDAGVAVAVVDGGFFLVKPEGGPRLSSWESVRSMEEDMLGVVKKECCNEKCRSMSLCRRESASISKNGANCRTVEIGIIRHKELPPRIGPLHHASQCCSLP